MKGEKCPENHKNPYGHVGVFPSRGTDEIIHLELEDLVHSEHRWMPAPSMSLRGTKEMMLPHKQQLLKDTEQLTVGSHLTQETGLGASSAGVLSMDHRIKAGLGLPPGIIQFL